MPNEWFPVVAAVLGALVGAGVAYAANRSRLILTIVRTSIAPSAAATESPVTVSVALKEAARNIPLGTGRDLPSGPTCPEHVYIGYLQDLKRTLDNHIGSIEGVTETVSKLRQYAANEEYAQLIDAYRFVQIECWAWAAVHTTRGKIIYNDAEKVEIAEADLEKHYIYPDGETYVFHKEGPQMIAFRVRKDRYPEGIRNRLKALSRRTAKAFALEDRADLMAYFDGIRAALAEVHTEARTLAFIVDEELGKYARVQIDFLVSNAGRTGASVGPDAQAVIDLKGYVHTNGKQGSGETVARRAKVRAHITTVNATSETFERQLLLTALSEGKAPSIGTGRGEFSPVVLQAGETVRLVATSDQLLSEHPEGAALKAAYGAAERSIELTVMKFRQPTFYQRRNLDSSKPIRSRKVLFRDLRFPD